MGSPFPPSFKPIPDEEGTEIVLVCPLPPEMFSCFKPIPDEEGTEISINDVRGIILRLLQTDPR